MGRGSYRGGSTIIRADPVMSLGGPTSSGRRKKNREKGLKEVDLRVFTPAERARILEKVRKSRAEARKREAVKRLEERQKKAAALAAIRGQPAEGAQEKRVVRVAYRPEPNPQPTNARRQTRLSLPAERKADE